MAKRSRSEELRQILFFIIVFTIIYTIIVFISSFFMMAWSWGEKQNTIQKAILFVLNRPLRPENGLMSIPKNGFIWGVIIVLLLGLIKKIRKKENF